MRSRLWVASLAVIAAVIVVTAQPVAASHTAVASIHSTGSDFNNASILEGVNVVGSGGSADVVLAGETIQDSFEDDDLTEYSGDLSLYDTNNNFTEDGSLGLEYQASGGGAPRGEIISTSGLAEYPDQGENTTLFVYITSATGDDGRFLFGTQDTDNTYEIDLNAFNNELRLNVVDSGSTTLLDSSSHPFADDTVYKVELEWTQQNQITISLTDQSSGSVVASVSSTDSTYSDGGLGFSTDGGPVKYDYVFEGSASPHGTYVGAPHTADNVNQGFTNLTLANASADITWQQSTDGGSTWSDVASQTFSSTGNHTQSFSGDGQWRVNVTFTSQSGNTTAELHDEGVEFQSAAPSADDGSASPAGGETIHTSEPTFEVDIEDADFGLAQSDTVNVTFFVDGVERDASLVVCEPSFAIEPTPQQFTSNGTFTRPADHPDGSDCDISLSDGQHTWHVVMNDSYGHSVTGSTYTFTVSHAAPELDESSISPANGADVSSTPVSLEINLTDADFPREGDSVTVTFTDEDTSSTIGTDTLSSNGTASVSWDPSLGENNWSASATDDYGLTDSTSTFSFNTPSNITFRNESNASEIVTGAGATATFYSEDGTVVVQRTDSDSDGDISLEGLPDSQFVVVVEASGWYDRRIYIESIFSQQNIYLLNQSAHPDAISTTFIYEDRTGLFPQESTTLRVQRAVDVNDDDNFTWDTVAGDFWGAAGEFPFTGEFQGRYRLVIENSEGTQRQLGTHIPRANGTKNVIVGQLTWPAENGTARVFDGELDAGANELTAVYRDPTNDTSEVRIRVWEYRNQSNTIYDQNHTAGPYGDLAATVSLTDNETEMTWVANFTAQHGADGTLHGQVVVGGNPVGLPLDSWLLGTFGWIFITFVACLYGPRTAGLGAWVILMVAGIAMIFQWMHIPLASFVAAGAVAAGGTFYREALP